MSSLWKRIKSGIAEVLKSRLFVAVIVFCIMSAVLIQRVFYLQIVKGQEYVENYKLQIQKTKDVEGTRGNIYDRNGKLLAYNELAYSVTIEDNGDYDSKEQKNKRRKKKGKNFSLIKRKTVGDGKANLYSKTGNRTA